jgi:hypothetical protein
MDTFERQIEELWAAVFGGPPPIRAAPHLMLEVLVKNLTSPPPYQIALITAVKSADDCED